MSLQPPKIELRARAVDGIDLLGALVLTTPVSLVAVRDGSPEKIDIAARAVPMEQVWDDIISRIGMTRVVQNNTQIVANACRMPLQAHPRLALDKDEPITLNFNEIAPEEFFALMARVLGLELSVPDGLPASRLAVLTRSRPVSEIIATVDAALALETRVVGRKLLVAKRPGTRRCMAVGQEMWQTSIAPPAMLEKKLNEFLESYSGRFSKPCKRLTSFPDTAYSKCWNLEYFPLRELSVRGLIRLTPKSPLGALVETPTRSFLVRLYAGDRVGEQAGVVTRLNSRELEIVEHQTSDAGGELRAVTRVAPETGIVLQNSVPVDLAAAPLKPITREGDLDLYDLEDVWVRSANEVKGSWQAVVTDPYGVDHVVRINDVLGTNDGKITKISAAEIHLEELVPDNAGGYMERATVLIPGVRYETPRTVIKRKYAAPVRPTRLQSEFIDAAAKGDRHRLEQLAAGGADIDAADGVERDNALVAAVKTGQGDAVAWLLAKGARANILIGPWEQTPLTVAATVGDLSMAKQLIKAGADVNLRDRHDRSAIAHALYEKHGSIVSLLVASGADLKTWSDLGITPFTLAAYEGQIDAVKLFLDHGVTVSDRDRGGHTLLGAAVQGDNRDLVQMLIGLGSDVNAISKYGESVLDLAKRAKKDPAIVALLVSHGAVGAKAG